MNLRIERIEKLLNELRYEIERGMMEREIDECISYLFYVPISSEIKDGVVYCEFRTKPVPRYYMGIEDIQPRLRIVK